MSIALACGRFKSAAFNSKVVHLALYRQGIILRQQAPMRLTVQMAASFSQIKNINAQSFFLSALTINRMLASLVFKKTKGTGFASNKALKTTPFGRSDAFTRGGFAIMPHATAPLSLMLGVIYLQH